MVTIMKWLGSLLFPSVCPGCGAWLKPQACWCASCERCFWEPRLLNGSRQPGGLDGCYALCRYDGAIRQVVRDMKFHGICPERDCFSPLLEKAPWPEEWRTAQLAVPIPLSEKRRKERGFNQTERIFRPWAEAAGYIWLDALQKIKDIPPQSGLSQRERRVNVKNAFAAAKDVVLAGKHILLVDDIYTTGSTMKEAAKILKKEKAAAVTGLVLCSSQ